MLHQTTMMECKLTRSLEGSAVAHPGPTLLRRGVEVRWWPRAAAASRRPGDTVWRRSATRLSLVPRRLDSKFEPHALYDIPSLLYPGPHRTLYDRDYDELRRAPYCSLL